MQKAIVNWQNGKSEEIEGDFEGAEYIRYTNQRGELLGLMKFSHIGDNNIPVFRQYHLGVQCIPNTKI